MGPCFRRDDDIVGAELVPHAQCAPSPACGGPPPPGGGGGVGGGVARHREVVMDENNIELDALDLRRSFTNTTALAERAPPPTHPPLAGIGENTAHAQTA